MCSGLRRRIETCSMAERTVPCPRVEAAERSGPFHDRTGLVLPQPRPRLPVMTQSLPLGMLHFLSVDDLVLMPSCRGPLMHLTGHRTQKRSTSV